MNVPTPVLAVEDLHVAFRGDGGERNVAVDGCSLALRRGETLGLVGESGCGKSTVALALMGLLPNAAEVAGGRALFDGADLLSLPPSAMRALRGRRIAMVFQDPMASLNPYLTVGTQIVEALRAHLPMDRRAAQRRAIDLLAQVAIPDPAQRLSQHPHQFSGGQRQRIMIAIALACDPEVLIADEPTTALDVTVQAQVLALLLVTHDLGIVAGTCDRVAVMYAGRVVEEAEVGRIFARPAHPYTRGLLAAVPRLDADRHAELSTIPGMPPALSDGWRGCAFAPRCPWAEDRCGGETPALRAVDDAQRHRCLRDLAQEPFPRARAVREAGS